MNLNLNLNLKKTLNIYLDWKSPGSSVIIAKLKPFLLELIKLKNKISWKIYNKSLNKDETDLKVVLTDIMDDSTLNKYIHGYPLKLYDPSKETPIWFQLDEKIVFVNKTEQYNSKWLHTCEKCWDLFGINL